MILTNIRYRISTGIIMILCFWQCEQLHAFEQFYEEDTTMLRLIDENINNSFELFKIKNTEKNGITNALHENELRINNEFIKTIEATTTNRKIVLLLIGILCFVSIYFLFYYRKKAKKNKGIFEKAIQNQEKQPKKAISKVKITDAKVDKILKRLDKTEQQGYYLYAFCSLKSMAKKAKTNTTYLSIILKEQKQKTFYQYLNELRIQYTINRLQNDKRFRKYTIKYIAKEVGYKSPESFTKHFKKTTGIYPSSYIKELERLNL